MVNDRSWHNSRGKNKAGHLGILYVPTLVYGLLPAQDYLSIDNVSVFIFSTLKLILFSFSLTYLEYVFSLILEFEAGFYQVFTLFNLDDVLTFDLRLIKMILVILMHKEILSWFDYVATDVVAGWSRGNC